jgi:hypothetical protein
MSLLFDSTAVTAHDRRLRRMEDATAHRQVREAATLRSRLSRSRRRDSRWQPVIIASVDLRCLRTDGPERPREIPSAGDAAGKPIARPDTRDAA